MPPGKTRAIEPALQKKRKSAVSDRPWLLELIKRSELGGGDL
jgi:hypothetical protein